MFHSIWWTASLKSCIPVQGVNGVRYIDTSAYVKPRTRTKFGERGFRFAGLAAWNSLPIASSLNNWHYSFNLNVKLELNFLLNQSIADS